MQFFDATRFKSPPQHPNFKRIAHLYEIDLLAWEDQGNNDCFPDEGRIKSAVEPHNGERITLNIEAWKFPYHPYDMEGIKASVDKYHDVLRWAKEAAPDSDIGLVNCIPNPYHPMRHRGDEWKNWNRCIEDILPMFEYADSMYPGAYAVYEETATWIQVADMRIYVASLTGKPTYPYCWHRAGGSIYNNELVRLPYIRVMLDHLLNCFMIDGIVWWAKSGEVFASSDSWWQELKRRMA